MNTAYPCIQDVAPRCFMKINRENDYSMTEKNKKDCYPSHDVYFFYPLFFHVNPTNFLAAASAVQLFQIFLYNNLSVKFPFNFLSAGQPHVPAFLPGKR